MPYSGDVAEFLQARWQAAEINSLVTAHDNRHWISANRMAVAVMEVTHWLASRSMDGESLPRHLYGFAEQDSRHQQRGGEEVRLLLVRIW